MASFTIGDVEDLTGIKPHILRYWEEVIPSFSPKKDIGGRRLYSSRDVQLVFRLKYLIYNKKYTIEGARNQLIAEADMPNETANLILSINELRGELLSLYELVQSHNNKEN